MTARPGTMPRSRSAAARRATSARSFLERAMPSISCAVMARIPGRSIQGWPAGPQTKKGRWWQRPLACASRSGFSRGRAERDLEEVRDGVRVELLHDVGAVRLDRLDADAEIVGDLLVEAAGDDALEHLRLARGEAREEGVAAGLLLVLREG